MRRLTGQKGLMIDPWTAWLHHPAARSAWQPLNLSEEGEGAHYHVVVGRGGLGPLRSLARFLFARGLRRGRLGSGDRRGRRRRGWRLDDNGGRRGRERRWLGLPQRGRQREPEPEPDRDRLAVGRRGELRLGAAREADHARGVAA